MKWKGACSHSVSLCLI